MTDIPVSEQFYSVQGEGKYVGTPSVFLRLSGCNLKCGLDESAPSEYSPGMEPEGDATWACDTLHVWSSVEEEYTAEELVDEWDNRGFLSSLENGAHLILTGGEPTLNYRQDQMIELFLELQDRGVSPFVEVETNGTIVPQPEFHRFIDHYNVSLKLSNSGMDEAKRINDGAIERYINTWRGSRNDALFKFVVSREEDIDEIKTLINEYYIPDDMIYLMPAGENQEKLSETYSLTAELVKENGWKFSPRLHVDIWNEMVGV